MTRNGLLFLSYEDTLALLDAGEALAICEDVYRMHARGTVDWTTPPSLRLDDDRFHHHWHVKGALLNEVPISGVRLYSYYEDGERSTVGGLDATRYVVLSDPRSSTALAIVDEHWTYAIRSAAAACLACKWMAKTEPRILGLVGVGTMGTAALECLRRMYRFREIRCTSRRPETRAAFARKWSERLGIPVIPVATPEDAVRGADIAVGGTTSTDIVSREPWLAPGCTFISLARRELDPAGWPKMDKIVVDDFETNMLTPEFRRTVADGLLARTSLHAEIPDLASGRIGKREHEDERVLIHTAGLVSQDIAICHFVYRKALEADAGTHLPLPYSTPGKDRTPTFETPAEADRC